MGKMVALLNLLNAFIDFAPLLKHYGFEEEHEVRAVICNLPPSKYRLETFINKEKLHIKFKFKKTSIKRIVVGPTDTKYELYSQVKNILNKDNGFKHVELSLSEIPVFI